MHENVYVHFYPLPGKITEAVCPCNGGYNVTIDPRQSHDGLVRSYIHALEHIENDDFEKDDVQAIEAFAHRKE